MRNKRGIGKNKENDAKFKYIPKTVNKNSAMSLRRKKRKEISTREREREREKDDKNWKWIDFKINSKEVR